jgi:hypothetical protein
MTLPRNNLHNLGVMTQGLRGSKRTDRLYRFIDGHRGRLLSHNGHKGCVRNTCRVQGNEDVPLHRLGYRKERDGLDKTYHLRGIEELLVMNMGDSWRNVKVRRLPKSQGVSKSSDSSHPNQESHSGHSTQRR